MNGFSNLESASMQIEISNYSAVSFKPYRLLFEHTILRNEFSSYTHSIKLAWSVNTESEIAIYDDARAVI